jgi:hypothetical protein
MRSVRSLLTCAGGALGSLLIAGGALLFQHTGALAAAGGSRPVAAVAPAVEPKTAVNRSNWKSLSPKQQQALQPLAAEWDTLDSIRKRKWLAIGNKYAEMSPAEQERVQTRMRDWIKLTPAQRRSVRESYTSTQKLNADQKSAQWQQYLQLSDEQKQALAKRKSHPAPATAVTRAKRKPAVLLPLKAEPPHETVIAPAAAAPATAPINPNAAPATPSAQPASGAAAPITLPAPAAVPQSNAK